jgi:hypothetical protein
MIESGGYTADVLVVDEEGKEYEVREVNYDSGRRTCLLKIRNPTSG